MWAASGGTIMNPWRKSSGSSRNVNVMHIYACSLAANGGSIYVKVCPKLILRVKNTVRCSLQACSRNTRSRCKRKCDVNIVHITFALDLYYSSDVATVYHGFWEWLCLYQVDIGQYVRYKTMWSGSTYVKNMHISCSLFVFCRRQERTCESMFKCNITDNKYFPT